MDVVGRCHYSDSAWFVCFQEYISHKHGFQFQTCWHPGTSPVDGELELRLRPSPSFCFLDCRTTVRTTSIPEVAGVNPHVPSKDSWSCLSRDVKVQWFSPLSLTFTRKPELIVFAASPSLRGLRLEAKVHTWCPQLHRQARVLRRRTAVVTTSSIELCKYNT